MRYFDSHLEKAEMVEIKRLLPPPQESFFLFGPRGTGKSTWLRHHFPDAFTIDLLKSETYITLLKRPQLIRDQVQAELDLRERQHGKKHSDRSFWVLIDEIQRIPELLNEVHFLMESPATRHLKFALSGSSARKLKRNAANLLAGRAISRQFFPLVAAEHQGLVSIEDILKFGCLPRIMTRKGTELESGRIDQLEAYVGTYLREEIKEEALLRRVDQFSRFLEIAAISHGQILNLNNVARDAMVARATVSNYLEILCDTLIGTLLPAWQARARVKEVSHPKFYFFDTGVVRALQGGLRDAPTGEERGILLETYVLHELRAWISYSGVGGELFFWRTQDGVEVDFIWKRGKTIVLIEVKSSKSWKSNFEKGFRAFSEGFGGEQAKYGIYLGQERLKNTHNLVLPLEDFLKELYAGRILRPT